ncbi:MAG: hypothetical protein HP042_01945, partial [Lachnospiraceae bacterium]|nr:hypothetical protein [Lachnospiraceae bacterium]
MKNKNLSVVSWRMYEKEITDYFFGVCCLRKARTRDLLRFLLDPCIHDLPFA